MFDQIKRLFGIGEAERPRARSLDAASVGRRFEHARGINSLNNDVFHGAQTVRARALHLATNNPNVSAGVNALVGAAIGTGMQPVPRHPDPELRKRIVAAWRRWTDVADAAGRVDFEAIQATAARSCYINGEAFAQMVVTDDGLRVRLVDVSQVPLDHHQNLPGGGIVRAGIEFSADGRWAAVHVYPTPANDPLQLLSLTPVRIPAEDFCHVLESHVPGQVRGLSRVASIVLRSINLDAFEDAVLMRQRIANLMAGFITDPDGTAAGLAGQGDQDGGALNLTLEPGLLVNLPPGANIEFSEPPDGGANYGDFVRSGLRAMASGLGCTYEAISGDYSSTNYSSARAAMVDMRRRVEQWQYLTFVPMFLNKVWSRWLAVEVLRGELPAAVLDEPGCDWLAPKWENPDPKATAETEEIELRNGLKSRTQAAAERGVTVDQLDAEISADRERERRLGLTFGEAPATPAPQQVQQPQADVQRAALEDDAIEFIRTWGKA